MDPRELSRSVSTLIEEKNFRRAEELLLQARAIAAAERDAKTTELVLSELVELYCVSEPPRLAEAEAVSIEREHLTGSAYSKLQTAMLLYHGARDYLRAVPMLEETIVHGKAECDDATIYTSLGLLGLAYLETGHTEKALEALSELEQMVAHRKSFVVGDETCFLEGLRARGLEIQRVTQLAYTLVPLCRDPVFKDLES